VALANLVFTPTSDRVHATSFFRVYKVHRIMSAGFFHVIIKCLEKKGIPSRYNWIKLQCTIKPELVSAGTIFFCFNYYLSLCAECETYTTNLFFQRIDLESALSGLETRNQKSLRYKHV
jgi:hypothetical protein